jgi:hypothetical protein
MEEFLAMFLPTGILDWFTVKEINKTDQRLEITLEEKNIVPELPLELRGKTVTSKGFKKIVVDDFPVRGRKTELIFLRRIWQIEGHKTLLKRDIKICALGTKLEKEFADFLKERHRYRINGH